MSKIIKVAEMFSKSPAGRYVSDGPFSGERFRTEFLVPLLQQSLNDNKLITIAFDGVLGLGSSFLEESFGGLVREENFTADYLKTHMEIEYELDLYKFKIWNYINDAQKKLDNK